MFIRNDLLGGDGIAKAIEGCDVVFHLAANPKVKAQLSKKSATNRTFK